MTSTATAPPVEDIKKSEAPAESKKEPVTRPYKVLQLDADGKAYKLVGEYDAGGDQAAIRMAAKEHGNSTYVAVSKSAWHERSPKVETREVVTWT